MKNLQVFREKAINKFLKLRKELETKPQFLKEGQVLVAMSEFWKEMIEARFIDGDTKRTDFQNLFRQAKIKKENRVKWIFRLSHEVEWITT